jgi:hypothetical protein
MESIVHLRWRVNHGAQDNSGERTLAACWQWHFAIANFVAGAEK